MTPLLTADGYFVLTVIHRTLIDPYGIDCVVALIKEELDAVADEYLSRSGNSSGRNSGRHGYVSNLANT